MSHTLSTTNYTIDAVNVLVYDNGPEDEAPLNAEEKTFMFGPKYLAAVLAPNVTEMEVYLPSNGGWGWKHYYSPQFYRYGSNATVPTAFDELPLFERQ